MPDKEQRYILRKASEDNPIGPLSKAELTDLAASARIAPEDTISKQGMNDWKPAPEYPFLEMLWKVPRGEEDNSYYGPTTIGTLRDFLINGELELDQEVEHIKTREKKKLSELVKDLPQSNIPDVEKETMPPKPPDAVSNVSVPPPPMVPKYQNLSGNSSEMEQVMETARELRIRQLEHDLRETQEKYDGLLQKYRKLSEQMLQTQK